MYTYTCLYSFTKYRELIKHKIDSFAIRWKKFPISSFSIYLSNYKS